MKLLTNNLGEWVEGTGWRKQYLFDQGITQNQTMAAEILPGRIEG